MTINRLLAWGSVLGALAILAFAIQLITKNTPRQIEGNARVMPPTQPRLVQTVESSGTANTESSGSAASPSHTDAKPRANDGLPSARFIGGIGIVEPAGEAVAIGTQLSGLVTEVLVKPGDNVKRGDPLFVLDARAAKANLDIAIANQKAAEAKLNELIGQIAPLRNKLDASQALLQQAIADQQNASQQYKRARQLAETSSISDEEVEARRLAFELSSARVAEAEARVSESKSNLSLLAGETSAPTLEVQRAAIEQARANVMREQTNVELHTVRAPLDSTILQVKIRVGEFAAAAVLTNALMVLGVIDPLHIRVEIDESEIPRFHVGATAYAAVRGRANQQVPMKFVRSEPFVVPKRSLSGGVSERVDTRVLQLIYAVSPSALDARVGQQVDVFIEEKSQPETARY